MREVKFGYKLKNGRIVKDKSEQMVIYAIRLLDKIGMSLGEISFILESKGFIRQSNRCKYGHLYMIHSKLVDYGL
jgi:hypothetical protein